MDTGNTSADVPAQSLPAAPDAFSHPDPLEFFRSQPGIDAVAAYTKAAAQQRQPESWLAAWLTASQAGSVVLALVTVATAASFLWSQQIAFAPANALVYILGIGCALLGINLLRAGQRGARAAISGKLAPQHLLIGAGALLAVAVVINLYLFHRIGNNGLALGGICLALAIVYALLPRFIGALPGEELLPATVLGPGLFFLTLQVLARSPMAHPSAWLLALGLGALALAAIVAARMREGATGRQLTTSALLGLRGVRAIYVGSLAVAYGCLLAAGLLKGAPHAVIAVLLSLPVAILPITGVIRATTPEALIIILSQTRRLILTLGAWLVVGLFFAGLFLRLPGMLSHLSGVK